MDANRDFNRREEPRAEVAADAEGQNIHFQETFVSDNGKLKLTFDYRIRDGEAQSQNAVALMKHIGLDLGEGASCATPTQG